MPTEQQKKKTAQTLLQTAQNPGTPQNMMRILGVAGEGIADFAAKAYENLVPQSVEEWALEGSPVGKAIGSGAKLLAGLPFAAYKNKLPFGKLFHGSPSAGRIADEGIDVIKPNALVPVNRMKKIVMDR